MMDGWAAMKCTPHMGRVEGGDVSSQIRMPNHNRFAVEL